MYQPKTKAEIEIMVEGGKKLGRIRQQLIDSIQVGEKPRTIDDLSHELIKKEGGEPSFMYVVGYRWATCICVNDCVVHGIPTTRPFRQGDIVCVDVGLLYKGFHTDTADTILIKGAPLDTNDVQQTSKELFLKTGKEALNKATAYAVGGNRIGHISTSIQQSIEGAGYSVVRSLVGHGIGKKLHEWPEVPGFLSGPIEKTPLLQNGMTIAIEVIYTQGKPEIMTLAQDGWTIVTKDHSLASVFEHTVLVDEKPRVLTK